MSVQKLNETILNKIESAAEKALGQIPEPLELDFPPNTELGHFAVGCFPLAKQFRKSPAEIAKIISEKITPDDVIHKVNASGPYLNIRLLALRRILFRNNF